MVKNLLVNSGDTGSVPGLRRSLGEGSATHSSILAGEIPWIEEPGGLQSVGLQSGTRLSDWTVTASSWFTDCVSFRRAAQRSRYSDTRPSLPASFPIQLVTERWVNFPVLYFGSWLITYFISSSVCVCVNPKVLIYPFPTTFPLWEPYVWFWKKRSTSQSFPLSKLILLVFESEINENL